jgi:glycine/D-amino acid oxidase-like deaminating enzyme
MSMLPSLVLVSPAPQLHTGLSQKQPELRVAVLEARGLCSGATGRNEGHIGRPEVYDYRELAKTFGTEDALRMRNMVLKNRDMMIECISQLDAAEKVDLRLNGTMVVFASQEERQKFEDDLKYAREQGYKEECRILSPEEILQV